VHCTHGQNTPCAASSSSSSSSLSSTLLFLLLLLLLLLLLRDFHSRKPVLQNELIQNKCDCNEAGEMKENSDSRDASEGVISPL